jgi:hypothetical protein
MMALRIRVLVLVSVTAAFLALPLVSVASAQDPSVSAQPSLYPAFDPGVTDYVVRCTAGTPVQVDVSAPAGTEVDVDGQGFRSGDFTASVSLVAGQSFRIVSNPGSTYFVRCLPSNFPGWTWQRSGQPQAQWYTVAPFIRTNFQPPPPEVSRNYVAIFDTNGVPVWWLESGAEALDDHLLSNGNVISAKPGRTEEYGLDGSHVRTITGVGPGIKSDEHETQLLPNGNYLLIVERDVPGFDFCGLTNQSITDFGFQEITPGGSVVRQWFPSEHIPMSELPPEWCNYILSVPVNGAYDVYHTNSLEPVGNDVVISFRHLNAVYRVNGTDGSIQWKLGGVPRPESLTVQNDPIPSTDLFRGQHDARMLSDGSVTVHDNGYEPTASRPPRAVRYAIDDSARTATLVEQVNDPSTLPAALCCGSARKLPGGDWVMSWGSDGLITELTSAGSRVFSLTFDYNLFSYRAHPVLAGELSATALRDGMDAQYPRGYARPKGANRVRVALVPAFTQCVSPDNAHGGPLVAGSCSSPTGTSSYLTIGTPDANGSQANAMGFVSYAVRLGVPSTPANEADVSVRVQLSDVRRSDDLSDYTGEVQLRQGVRITDRLNGSLQNEAATGFDTELPATAPCAATESANVGSTCSLSSSFNAILPGSVIEGKRATWQLERAQVFDGGASGVAGSSGATLFETQGVFVP